MEVTWLSIINLCSNYYLDKGRVLICPCQYVFLQDSLLKLDHKSKYKIILYHESAHKLWFILHNLLNTFLYKGYYQSQALWECYNKQTYLFQVLSKKIFS